MEEKIYTGFSMAQFAWMMLQRVLAAFGIFFCSLHYEENRPLFAVVIAILVLLILVLGEDQIVIYKSRVVYSNNSIFSLICRLKGKQYFIDDMKAAYQQSSGNFQEIGFAFFLAMLLPKKSFSGKM